MRYGYHLVTDCLKANQGKKSHKDEATIIHHFNTYTNITATKAKPFPDGKQADILLSGITSIDNLTARNWHLNVTSTNPMGVTNQEFINRADLGHQPGPGEHDPRNDVLTSAKRAEERKHTKYDAICAATGSVFSPFALETTGGHGASAASVYFLFEKQMRDSGLPADVLLGKFKKDIPFALRRGTIAQVTTALERETVPFESVAQLYCWGSSLLHDTCTRTESLGSLVVCWKLAGKFAGKGAQSA